MSDLSKISAACTIDEKDIHANVNQLKNIRNEFEELTLIDSAKFFTDKLVTLEGDQCQDEIYNLAKILHEKEEFHRAAFLITSRNFHIKNLSFRYLAAKCHFDCKEYTKALEILTLPIENNVSYDEKNGTSSQWQSSIELLKGYIYQLTDNRQMANKCFLNALQLDIYCYEAFQALVRFDMISKDQENQLLSILNSDEAKFSSSTINFIKYFYTSQLKKCDTLKELSFDEEFNSTLSSSMDMQLIRAEQYYNDCCFKDCYSIIQNVYSKDLFNQKCLLLMIGCLMEMGDKIELQNIAHKLVEVYPENPISWYAVGCYYYMNSNADNARKYFSKSTSIDSNFQPSMLMYGHSFEMEALHDQAFAVYLDLSKVMCSSCLPLLYIGVEYSHLNNAIMAERYLNQALQLSQNNLFVLHELGIVFYQKKNYEMANKHFSAVYNILATKHLMASFPEKWEPLFNNLGHVCRKLGKYDDAITYHKNALRMLPQNASTYDALGLVYSLKDDLQMACDCFQKALGLKRDDAFAMTMHNIVYQEIIEKEISNDLS